MAQEQPLPAIRLAIRVQPGAKSNEVVGWMADAHGGRVLKIRLRAPAVEGKANAALLDFLAETFGVRSRQIVLEQGDKSREKIVRIEGLPEERMRKIIN
ncbi:MAG: DUF167 domain-containing protein [Methylacidiphilales bacterium]|nr:DUF167 domain-containing protein [Candidatus Methylacidiphilales bacterium]